MRFGIFSVVDHYPKELGRTPGELYEELLEQAEAADKLGFDSFWIAEHHFHTLVEQEVVAFGDPDEITRVARLYERAGFTDFLAIPNFGGLPHKRVLRSMDLMAKQVLPRFHPAGRA